MNILEIIIIAAGILFVAAGYRRGFVKKLASMMSLVLSIVIVSVSLPYLTDFLKNNTPVYEYIVKQCSQVVQEQAVSKITSGGTGNSLADTYENMGRDQIKELLEQNGYDSTLLDSLSDEQLEQYKEQYIQQYVGQYLGGQEQQGSQLTRIEQTEIIENLPFPETLKDLLLDYNNDEGYESLKVSTFQDYIVNFIATIILNVISFVAACILVRILLWGIIAALNIVSYIPVINIVNRLAGAALGLVHALFFVWVFFLFLSMASGTEVGLNLLSMVQKSQFLSWLYDQNLFMKIVLQATAIFA